MADKSKVENGNECQTDPEKNDDHGEQRFSKRQLRKLKKQEKWLANKPAKRAKEREKLKLKRQAARENNVDLGPSRKILKRSTMENSSCKIRVAVDMSFDDYMPPKDLSKCIKQLLRCYTLNRRAPNPMQLYFTSFEGKCKEEMSKNNGYNNWDVNFYEKPYLELFPKEEIVYLSSESENVITALQEDKVYIIGGLVDHNSHKGLCHRLATENGVSHGQLPIGDFIEMNSRKVLAINHVFEILLGVSTGLSWQDAFLQVIPQRKGAIGKDVTPSTSTENIQTEDACEIDKKVCDDRNKGEEKCDEKSGIVNTEKVKGGVCSNSLKEEVGKFKFNGSDNLSLNEIKQDPVEGDSGEPLLNRIKQARVENGSGETLQNGTKQDPIKNDSSVKSLSDVK